MQGVEVALVGVGEEAIQRALYTFGRWPYSPTWAARMPRETLVLDHLTDGNENLLRDWVERAPPRDNDRWRIYGRPGLRQTRHLQCKLYVNLTPDALAAALADVLQVVARAGAPMFKFARDVQNLIRPDKFVIYLSGLAELQALARALRPVVSGLDVQPLPFTGALDERGGLSCGFDPEPSLSRHLGATSWRGWITASLSPPIQAAVRRAAGAELAARHAIEEIRRMGVDIQRWAPSVLR